MKLLLCQVCNITVCNFEVVRAVWIHPSLRNGLLRNSYRRLFPQVKVPKSNLQLEKYGNCAFRLWRCCLHQIIVKGTAITAKPYLKTTLFQKAIKNRRIFKLNDCIILLHDNTRSYGVHETQTLLWMFKWKV